MTATDKHEREQNSTATPDWLWLSRQMLKALIQADLGETPLRVALVVLQESYLRGRDAAHFQKQEDIATLDGRLDKQAASRAGKALIAMRVLERDCTVFSFRPVEQWVVASRTPESRRTFQLELEIRLDRIAQQLGLKLWELNAQVREDFLRNRVVPGTTAVVSHTTRGVVPGTTAVVSHTTQPSLHINVSTDRDLKRSTLNASKAREEFLLDQVKQFFQDLEPKRAQEEMENSGGFWRKIIRAGHGDALERAMGEIRYQVTANGRAPEKNFGAWLTSVARECIGKGWPEVWGLNK